MGALSKYGLGSIRFMTLCETDDAAAPSESTHVDIVGAVTRARNNYYGSTQDGIGSIIQNLPYIIA